MKYSILSLCFFLCILSVCIVSGKPNEDDVTALNAIRDATGFDGWTNKENWDSDDPCAYQKNWVGIQCDNETGRVKGVNLGFNKLVGTIPTEIALLSEATSLIFQSNQLSGALPTEIGTMTKLTHILLMKNKFSGQIPTQLGDLENLIKLQLDDNAFGGNLPSELAKTKLSSIKLPNNLVSGTIPSEYAAMDSLESLDFENNKLSGSLSTAFGESTSLKFLYLSQNSLDEAIPETLGPLDLAVLKLDNNSFGCFVPDFFVQATGDVTASNNGFLCPIPGSLQNLECEPTTFNPLTDDEKKIEITDRKTIEISGKGIQPNCGLKVLLRKASLEGDTIYLECPIKEMTETKVSFQLPDPTPLFTPGQWNVLLGLHGRVTKLVTGPLQVLSIFKNCPGDNGGCDNEGSCNTLDGTCFCRKAGTYGPTCNMSCPLTCSGFAKCSILSGDIPFCDCPSNRLGVNCEIPMCPDPTCSGHGDCDLTSGNCTCYAPYIGETCKNTPNCDKDCGEHGECKYLDGVKDPVCKCTDEYGGADCKEEPDSGPNIGLIIGLSVLAVVLIVILILLIIFCRFKKPKD